MWSFSVVSESDSINNCNFWWLRDFSEKRSKTHEAVTRASASGSQHSSIVAQIIFKPLIIGKNTKIKWLVGSNRFFVCFVLDWKLKILTSCSLHESNIFGRSFLLVIQSCIVSRVGLGPSYKANMKFNEYVMFSVRYVIIRDRLLTSASNGCR